jgi:hypothetical protein
LWYTKVSNHLRQIREERCAGNGLGEATNGW